MTPGSLWSSLPVLALLAGAPSAPDAPSPAPTPAKDGDAPKRTYVVAAMGDSLTDRKSHGGLYLDHLKKKCPKSRFDSYGKGGQMVSQMRKRFERDIFGEDKPKYTHVIILGGIGDILSNETAKRTTTKITADLAAMYATAKKHDTTVIAMTLPPWGGAKAYNEARDQMTGELVRWVLVRKKALEVDVSVDIYSRLSCGKDRELCDDYAWPDKLHWNKAGHEVVGEVLFESVFADCE
ncbi:MAG: hypothetical protein JNL21_34715 [Myxococcales bacterium]|nr:hypothetical protein [Myxococcales bacterium]